ncbi:MAG: M24 family metallopeptidase [Clostridiaceae bacterium]
MKEVTNKPCHPFFLEEEPASEIIFSKEDYKLRLDVLTTRMREKRVNHVLIYGDRENFAHIEYFSGYDCRFEEGLLIIEDNGKVSIAVGNEGISQTYPIPYDLNVYLYQNFSLQGQPRDRQKKLSDIFKKCGITKESAVGVVGYKYFNPEDVSTEPDYTFDIPAYILNEIYEVADKKAVKNFTREITGFPDGIRMTIRTAKEIAWIESAGNRTAAVVQRMLKSLKPGMSERETAISGHPGFEPVTMYPLVNFGAEKVRIGVASPTDRTLETGDVCGLCYATRGNLTSRVGIAAYNFESVKEELKPHMEFYKYYWKVLTEWLEYAHVGAKCDELYEIVMGKLGTPEYGMVLNPTHYSGTDEWNNSPVFKNSPYTLLDGSHIQVDMIASKSEPVMAAICEDCIVVAGAVLQAKLKAEYPEVYERTMKRRKMIHEELGIDIHSDILPMSNLNFVYFPYMLNAKEIFALSE